MASVAALFGLSACGNGDDDTSSALISAGSSGATTSGRVVTLNGNATAGATGMMWTQVSGPAVTLTGTGATATFIAPSMNPGLWSHPRTRASLHELRAWGCTIIDPQISADRVVMASADTVLSVLREHFQPRGG